MRKTIWILLALSFALGLLAGCGAKGNKAPATFPSLYERGRVIGVGTGTGDDAAVREEFPDAEIRFFNDGYSGLAALAGGKLDAFVEEKLQMGLAIRNGQTGVAMLDETVGEGSRVAVGLSPVTPIPELEEKLNAFIGALRADGTLDDMYERWVFRREDAMPEIAVPEQAPLRLRVGTSGMVAPFTYYSGTELIGYDVELARRFAAWLGASLELRTYDYAGLIAAAQGGDVDCLMSELYVTPERAEAIPFSEPLFTVERGVAVRASGVTSFSQLAAPGTRIGVPGDIPEWAQLREDYPAAEIVAYTDDPLAYQDVASGRLDAYVYARRQMELAIASGTAGVRLLDENYSEHDIAVALSPLSPIPELEEKINAFIGELRADGTLDDMYERWVVLGDETMPDLPEPEAPAFRLRVGTTGTIPPYSYYAGPELRGYDIELARRFAAWLGASLEFRIYDFGGIIAAGAVGEADCLMSNLFVTPEIREQTPFSDVLFRVEMTAMVRDDGGAGGASFGSAVASSFEKTFLRESRWKLFARGVGTTLLITALSVVFGTALGFGAFLLCRRGNPVANALTRFFVWLVQGLPTVVLLMILYYVVFGKVAVSGTAVSVVGFSLVFGAAVFSMVRSGVATVDRGQTEAAYALGYTDRRAFFRVVLPQALPHFMPAYKGQISALVKATAIVGYVAVQDLTKMGDIVRSRTYDAFFPLIAVAVIYFLLAAALTFLVGRIGPRGGDGNRKRSALLKGVRTE